MTTRIFCDSTKPGLVPVKGTDGILPYVNGDYAWSNEQIAPFVTAGKQVVRIDVLGNAPRKASILDVERYDATVQNAKTWVPERNAFRMDATVYCARNTLEELFATVLDPFWLILADPTGVPHTVDIPLPTHVHMAGTQFSWLTNYDVTCITADGWHPRNHKNWFPLQEKFL